jgi:hypothetical protein
VHSKTAAKLAFDYYPLDWKLVLIVFSFDLWDTNKILQCVNLVILARTPAARLLIRQPKLLGAGAGYLIKDNMGDLSIQARLSQWISAVRLGLRNVIPQTDYMSDIWNNRRIVFIFWKNWRCYATRCRDSSFYILMLMPILVFIAEQALSIDSSVCVDVTPSFSDWNCSIRMEFFRS